MPKYRLSLHCHGCGHNWKKAVSASDRDTVDSIPNPPCPKCKKRQKSRGMDFSSGRAPSVGGSVMARAIEESARIVMEDHKMTDLKDHLREGETMAPSLPPQQQAKVEAFWGGPKRQRLREAIPSNLQPTQLGNAALAGAYRGQPDVVGAMHRAKSGLKTNVVASDRPKIA